MHIFKLATVVAFAGLVLAPLPAVHAADRPVPAATGFAAFPEAMEQPADLAPPSQAAHNTTSTPLQDTDFHEGPSTPNWTQHGNGIVSGAGPAYNLIDQVLVHSGYAYSARLCQQSGSCMQSGGGDALTQGGFNAPQNVVSATFDLIETRQTPPAPDLSLCDSTFYWGVYATGDPFGTAWGASLCHTDPAIWHTASVDVTQFFRDHPGQPMAVFLQENQGANRSVWVIQSAILRITIGQPQIGVPSPINFGSQAEGTQSPTQLLTVSNVGNAPLTVSSVSLVSSTNFTMTANYCNTAVIAPGASCNTVVAFNPQALGSLSTTATIVSNDPNTPSASASLSGYGVAGPPPAPRYVVARPADGSILLTWVAPALDGGSPITAYNISGGGQTATTNGTTYRQSFPGLTNGYRLTFTISATNAIGTGPQASASGTPAPVQAVFPVTMNNAYGGYTTTTYIQNIGTAPAIISVQYFDSSGNPAGFGEDFDLVQQNGMVSRSQGFGNAFGFGGAGSAVVYSTQPVAAFVNELPPGGDATSYTAFSPTALGSTLYAAAIFSSGYGFTTGIGLVNTSTTTTTVTITYYDGAGTQVGQKFFPGLVGGAYAATYSGNSGQASDSLLAPGFIGTAIITTSPSVLLAAIVNELGPNGQFSSYDAVPAGATTLYAPTTLKNAYGGYNTGVALQNIAAAVAHVTITYYDALGVATPHTLTIPAHGSTGVYQGDGVNSPPAAGAYTAMIGSDVAVVAIVNEVAPPSNDPHQFTSYNTFLSGVTTAHLPLVENAGSDGWSTAVGVMNTGTSSTTVTLTYYAGNSPIGTAQLQAIPAKGVWSWYQPTSGLPVGSFSAVLTTTGGGTIAVICNESNGSTFMSYNAV